MDRITKSLINELLKSLEQESKGDAKDFELIANYSVLNNEYNSTFNLDYVTVGDGNDTGIDGIAIIVNGVLLESTGDIDECISRNKSLDVEYIFVQAKSSEKFDGSKIHNFLFGIEEFFKGEDSEQVRNDDIQHFVSLSEHLLKNAHLFKKNPLLKIFYVSAGKWNNDTDLVNIINTHKKALVDTVLFDDVIINMWGSNELGNAFRKTKNAISTTFSFTNKITIPQITGISQAYIGCLPFDEFRKIITDENGNMLNVFEDNVRDFQGDNNDVNHSIASTLENDCSEIFTVLNNGITIVAKSISPTGNMFTITDYQIVNGCQTTNVLFNCKEYKNISNVNIPVKLIATDDEDVKTRITLATNNQTPIKREQLAVLTQFQRKLEIYYNTFEKEDQRLYYERRAKQYCSRLSIPRNRIITVAYQIKTFSAMFLGEPHNVTSYFGSILSKMNEKKIHIFHPEDEPISYYTAAYIYYKLDNLLKKSVIDKKYKPVKFHILLIFKILFQKFNQPNYNNKKMNEYCTHLLRIANDNTKIQAAFEECLRCFDECSDFNVEDKQDVKLVNKTKSLITIANQHRSLKDGKSVNKVALETV